MAACMPWRNQVAAYRQDRPRHYGAICAMSSGRFTATEVAEMLRMPKQARVRNVAPRADRTYGGRVYHSKAEALYAFELDAQMSACMIFKWRPQVTLPCIVNG